METFPLPLWFEWPLLLLFFCMIGSFFFLFLSISKRGEKMEKEDENIAPGDTKKSPPFYFSLFFLVRCQKATSGGDTTPYGGPLPPQCKE